MFLVSIKKVKTHILSFLTTSPFCSLKRYTLYLLENAQKGEGALKTKVTLGTLDE